MTETPTTTVTVHLGADHGGFELKQYLYQQLEASHYLIVDHGAKSLDPNDDYPEFAVAVAEAVVDARQRGEQAFGVLACRSSAGVVIAANKVAGARAVSANSPQVARHAREHNDAQIIAVAGDWTTPTTALETVLEFITTPFSGEERHLRRLNQIAEYEQRHSV